MHENLIDSCRVSQLIQVTYNISFTSVVEKLLNYKKSRLGRIQGDSIPLHPIENDFSCLHYKSMQYIFFRFTTGSREDYSKLIRSNKQQYYIIILYKYTFINTHIDHMDLHIIPATVGYYENLFSNQPAS
jgi:hypothetical protein